MTFDHVVSLPPYFRIAERGDTPNSDQITSQIAVHPSKQATQRELLFVCSHARFSSAGPVFTRNGILKSTEHCL